MSFLASAMFPGDMFDTAVRLAESPESEPGNPAASRPSGKWQQMLALGWQGVLVPEENGGVGATLADLAGIIEAGARHVILAPLIERCAVAPVLLRAVGGHVSALLESISVGDASVCPVLQTGDALPGPHDAPRLDGGPKLGGTLCGANLSEPASHVLFNVFTENGDELVVLPIERLADRARYFDGLDGSTTADFTLDELSITDNDIVLRGAGVAEAVAGALQVGTLLACVQAVGTAGAMIEQTIDYLNTRIQFGVALATFQALRHRLVEMYVSFENARGMVSSQIGEAAANLNGFARDAALTKLYCAGMSRRVAEAAIQLHGGMGMTWEMPAARLALHSLTTSERFGDRAQCLDWLTARAVAKAAA